MLTYEPSHTRKMIVFNIVEKKLILKMADLSQNSIKFVHIAKYLCHSYDFSIVYPTLIQLYYLVIKIKHLQ